MKRISIRNKPIGFHLQGISLALLLICSIVYFALDKAIMTNISFADYSWLIFLFNLLAAAIGFVSLFFYEPIRPIASILQACGVGQILSMACYPWADIATNVFFFSNTQEKAIQISCYLLIFLILFFLLLVCGIVSCFMKTEKEEETGIQAKIR